MFSVGREEAEQKKESRVFSDSSRFFSPVSLSGSLDDVFTEEMFV